MRLPSPPEPPRPAARTPFPVIAVAAPMVGAVVIGLVIGSPFMLLFAALGPIVAIATVLDARRSARRHRRLEAERFDRECDRFELAIDRAHAAERRAAIERYPRIARSLSGTESSDLVRVGTAPAPSAVSVDAVRLAGDSEAEQRLIRMLARAQLNPELPALIERGPVVIVGRGVVAEGLARRLAREPGVVVRRAADADTTVPELSPAAAATVITVLSATEIDVHTSGSSPRRVRPDLVSERQLDSVRSADERGERLPAFVAWSELQSASEPHGDHHAVPIGVDDAGVVALDLVRSGPHALVGGTTGSGKSELLRSLALGWAAAHPPSAAQLLFVDFKGGATFSGLTELPHSIGLVTDLDPLVAQRALRSLRAELRHRERVLAEAGIRDVRDGTDLLPRLLVLVDEFATLSATFPDLHEVFSDLAARGRSLGVHLVLCTQHPASIVRDAIAANCPVRLSFRVTEAGSGGIVGSLARELVAAPPGRAALVDERGERVLQVAVVDDDDVAFVRERWHGHQAAASTWSSPLPERVEVTHLPTADLEFVAEEYESRAVTVVPFGLLDDPDERRRLRADWHPHRDGPLAVLGASKSGRTTALAALAHGLPDTAQAVVLPDALPDAWAVLERLATHAPPASVLFCDGLDALVARSGDRAAELLARWDSAVRAMRASGGGAAASFAAASSAGALVGGRFESRLVLRCADADEHAMVGAPRALFDRSAPAGRGWWRELQVQVALPQAPLPAPDRESARLWRPDHDRDALVVTSRVADIVDLLGASGLPHRVVLEPGQLDATSLDPDASVALAPRLVVAAPGDWQAAWALLAAARTRVPIVLTHVDHADVRSLLGHREALPPIDASAGECWLAEPGRPLVRALWPAIGPAQGATSTN